MKTTIKFKSKYKKIIFRYLTDQNLKYNILNNTYLDKLILVEIENLNSEDAFYLGVNSQVQLIDGEILI